MSDPVSAGISVAVGLGTMVAELGVLIAKLASGGISEEDALKERDEIIARNATAGRDADAADKERDKETQAARDKLYAGEALKAKAGPPPTTMTGLLSDDGGDAE
jgi:hypothetical protein